MDPHHGTRANASGSGAASRDAASGASPRDGTAPGASPRDADAPGAAPSDGSAPAAARRDVDAAAQPEGAPREAASGTSAASVASVRGASRTYARASAAVRALHDVSLEVRAGEMVALVGPSGCGKSTLLNLLSGVDRADSGSVVVGGIDLQSATPADLVRLRRTRVGIVFQSFHLVPHLTVEENVALPLALAKKRDEERVALLLERVGLTSRRTHFPSELSGGEQQRTAVARALVHFPALVLADEPTGNLDSKSGAEVLELLRELRAEHGAALVLATHDERIAASADRIVHLRDGEIVPS
jgi:putative ABC transport system ATP-binding protein